MKVRQRIIGVGYQQQWRVQKLLTGGAGTGGLGGGAPQIRGSGGCAPSGGAGGRAPAGGSGGFAPQKLELICVLEPPPSSVLVM